MIGISEKEYIKLSEYIESNYGIHLGREKKTLIIGRLANVLVENGFKNFSDYYDYIISDNTNMAISTLVDKITTNHTYFMREFEHFEFFANTVLPYLSKNVATKDLSIWSAGCSTGEEPYTLAILIDKFFNENKYLWNTKILATDLSLKVLDIAKKGIYSNEQLLKLPKDWLCSYFKKINNQTSEISEKIKNEVIFRRFNLIDKVFPFKKKFHAIFCRNVMIYFNNQVKNELLEKFYDITEYGGYLFIGHSENIQRDISKYKFIAPAIYRKE